MTIFGNILVVLSVIVYKRMRTFTNILLTSLATAGIILCVLDNLNFDFRSIGGISGYADVSTRPSAPAQLASR